MNKYLKPVLFVCALGLVPQVTNAQDIHFSQFYENAILRNPALTGIFSGDYKAGVNYRNQWSNISVPFTTGMASAETRVAVNKEVGDYVSFGVSVSYDHAGSIDFNSMQVYPAINYNKSMEDRHNTYLSVGFAAGYIQRSFDITKMTFTSQYMNGGYSQYNPSGENIGATKVQNYDLAAGVSINSSMGENNNINYYIGAAAYHVTQPNQTFEGSQAVIRLTTRWCGNLGIKYDINKQYSVTVHANYTNQSPYQETIFGGFVSYHNITSVPEYNFTISGGLFSRLHDALIPTVKLDYSYYSITFSYDVNNSTLKPASEGVGGYEISLYVRGNYKRQARATDATRCPHFEGLNNGMEDY